VATTAGRYTEVRLFGDSIRTPHWTATYETTKDTTVSKEKGRPPGAMQFAPTPTMSQ
jgi:hypothetical protein